MGSFLKSIENHSISLSGISEKSPLVWTISDQKRSKKKGCPANDDQRYSYWIAVVSAIVNLVFLITCVICVSRHKTTSTFAFLIDCGVDMLSSAVLIWRFSVLSSDEKDTESREGSACFYLGLLFIVSGGAVVIDSGLDIAKQQTEELMPLMLYTSIVAAITWLILFILKLVLFLRTRSTSMLYEAINSFVSSIFAFVVVIAYCVKTEITDHSSTHLMEPICSLLLAVFIIVYGIRILLYGHDSNNNNNYVTIP